MRRGVTAPHRIARAALLLVARPFAFSVIVTMPG
jgi:hypothetical protein